MFASLALVAVLLAAFSVSARADGLELYIDADYSVNGAAAEAIELGVRSALAVDGGMVGTDEIAVIPMDHRGNVKRSHHTMKRYLESDSALAIIGGLHSPPYLTHREFLNENRILTLLPWSAAGPATRARPGDENWIYRLSVDDFHSGGYLVGEAVEREGCARIALILMESGWGRANLETLSGALKDRGLEPAVVKFFDNTIGQSSARRLAEDVARAGADCGILLSNWNDGANLVNALAEHVPGFRILSHWGITGGAFADRVPHETRGRVQLRLLQTCALRSERDGSVILREAVEASGDRTDGLIRSPAAAGFAHGHDLTRILLAAIRQASRTAEWPSGDIEVRRAAVRRALETLETPVPGILRTYTAPFRPYSVADPDAHEALGPDDLCMARFRRDGMLENAD